MLLATAIGVTPGCGPDQPATGSGHLIGRATFDTVGGDVRTSLLNVADSEEERRLGLMGRASLAASGGMVFIFPAPTSGSFWMKDTLIPLSIAFWDEDGTVVDILEMQPCETDPCPTYSPRNAYTHAIEMNAGWFEKNGVEIGDGVELVVGTE